MAFTSIPNEAIDRMTELSAGALRLYLFLAHCRNTKTGKCCPSVGTTAEAIGVHRRNIFKLRNELAAAGWARFDGDNATGLLGSNSGKNATNNVVSIEDIPITEETGKNATTLTVSTGKNATKQWQKCQLKVAKMPVACKEELDERTRRIEQDELIHEIFTYWQTRLNHPRSDLTGKRKSAISARLNQGYTVEEIKQAIDGCASSPYHMGDNDQRTVYDDLTLICRDDGKLQMFISKVNQHTRSNGNGRNQIPHKETHNERAARETAELIASAFQASGGADSPDSADTGEAWLAADFRRV